MYAITEGIIRINGEAVNTFEREIDEGKTVLKVTAGTSGYQKDASRAGGSRTYLSLDRICGDCHFRPILDGDGKITGIEIAGFGNESLDAMLKALAFAGMVLDDQRRNVKD